MAARRFLGLCLALSVLDVVLVGASGLLTGTPDVDLVWNLALAWAPLVAALALDDVRDVPLALQLPLFALWLAFFPNAPYLVTDLIHVDSGEHGLPAVLYALALVAGAGAGLALAFSSLLLVERVVRGRFGPSPALAASLAALAAASVGIYLGRVLRLNSWDILARPRVVADSVRDTLLDPLAHPKGVTGTLAFGALLVVCYLQVRRAASPDR